jgi:hypothetical protein
MADRRCYYCGTRGTFTNKLYEYPIENMISIYACDACEQRSNWNAVFVLDKGDINTRNIGGAHEG